MKESILKRYPELTEQDIEVRDDMDGRGAYIGEWNSDKPKPTIEQLNQWVEEDEFIQAKQNKQNELDTICESMILDKFKVNLNGIEYEFSYDMKAQSRFNGTGVLFLGGTVTEVPWTAYENGDRVRINLTKDDFDIVSLGALYHQNSNIVKYNNLLNDVEQAISIEDIEAISW